MKRKRYMKRGQTEGSDLLFDRASSFALAVNAPDSTAFCLEKIIGRRRTKP
jgi:hypothetical protein